jgi:hypothetical protein
MPVPRDTCIEGPPLIRFGGDKGATLNYNLPQASCFSARGSTPLPTARSWFLDTASLVPQVHWC